MKAKAVSALRSKRGLRPLEEVTVAYFPIDGLPFIGPFSYSQLVMRQRGTVSVAFQNMIAVIAPAAKMPMAMAHKSWRRCWRWKWGCFLRNSRRAISGAGLIGITSYNPPFGLGKLAGTRKFLEERAH